MARVGTTHSKIYFEFLKLRQGVRESGMGNNEDFLYRKMFRRTKWT